MTATVLDGKHVAQLTEAALGRARNPHEKQVRWPHPRFGHHFGGR